MKKTVANNLVKSICEDLGDSAAFKLLESKTALPLSGFHTFADGHRCLGAFLIAGEPKLKLWILIIDWKDNGNFYVVIYPERHNAPPIAELHNLRTGRDSLDLAWSYKPSKRDGRNSERKKVFLQSHGGLEYVVSVPSAVVTLDDFLSDVFSLASLRIATDELEKPPNFPSQTGFPEGRCIGRLHKSRERNPAVVRLAKAEHRRRNNGTLPCEVCRFDFSKRYGELGESYIDAHHIRPLSELGKQELRDTRVEDLALVCANCHRMLHLRRPWASVEQLRELLRNET